MAGLGKKMLKRKVTAALELPKDIILDLPTIALVGDEEITISNHKGIGGYTGEQVRVKTAIGMVLISGHKLVLKEVGKEDIVIHGKIKEIVMMGGI